jgi:hypothetical protein
MDYVAISASCRHGLALRSDGSVVGWGMNGDGECDVPDPNTDFVAVAAGAYCSLGLKSDGSVVSWGWDGGYPDDIPEPNSGFVAIAAGPPFVGLKEDGSVVTWGYGAGEEPTPNEDFVSVAASIGYALGIRSLTPVAVEDDHPWPDDGNASVPRFTRLLGAYPNPFNPRTTIAFALEQEQHVTVDVLNLHGARVRVLVAGTFGAGEHTLTWDGLNAAGQMVPSGTYLIRLQTPNSVQSRKAVLVR